MRKYSRLERQTDFEVPLLEVLADMPGHQGEAAAIVAEVIARHHRLFAVEAMQALPSGELRCVKWIHWRRLALVHAGLMDTPGWGVWRITAKGLDWLRDNPDSTTIDLRSRSTKVKAQPRNLARKPAGKKPVSGDEQARWLAIIEQEVRTVREFLHGRGIRPSDERLCDLVQLCYLLGLYQEVCDLFPLIDSSGVNQWLYARTSRLAKVCAGRVG